MSSDFKDKITELISSGASITEIIRAFNVDPGSLSPQAISLLSDMIMLAAMMHGNIEEMCNKLGDMENTMKELTKTINALNNTQTSKSTGKSTRKKK